MKSVDVFIRYSDLNVRLDKIATLSMEDNLIYNDDGGDLKAHLKTGLKFAALTATSPLISLTRLVRSAAFALSGEAKRAGREFVGALAAPFVATGCLSSTLLASVTLPISSAKTSFYINARRTYAAFEAWVNGIDLKSAHLASYSQRVSDPLDPSGEIWTTAPCMQPLFEKGISNQDGLLDRARIQKMFPFIKVNDVFMEKGKIVIQSEYANGEVHYTGCNEACEHKKITTDFCCCYRIEIVYDRILCCEIGKGTCSSKMNSGDSCGIVSCSCGGLGACCCYTKEDHSTTSLNTGCFGPEGFFYMSELRRTSQ